MWVVILINNMVHLIANPSRDEYAGERTQVLNYLLRSHDDGLMASKSDFNLLSYKYELARGRTIVFSRRSIIATMEEEKPFLQWEIFIRAYTKDVVNIQQLILLCIGNKKAFENCTNDMERNVSYERVVVGQGSPDNRDVRSVRCG